MGDHRERACPRCGSLLCIDACEPSAPQAPDYFSLAESIARTVREKQAAYGDAFGRAGEVMRVFYPGGIAPEQMDDALAVVRIVDKLFRVANRREAFGESPALDGAGYFLLMAERHGRRGAAMSAAACLAPFVMGPITIHCHLESGHAGPHHSQRAERTWSEPSDHVVPQRPASLRAEVERLRAEAAILGPEMVDLQHRLLRAEQERDEARGEVLDLMRMLVEGRRRLERLRDALCNCAAGEDEPHHAMCAAVEAGS